MSTSDPSPPKKEAAPARAASSGEEAGQASHAPHPLARPVTQPAPRIAAIRESLGNRAVLIRVAPFGKNPTVKEWQRIGVERMDDPAYLATLNHGCNIGVPLGAQSAGLCTLDLDDADELVKFLACNPDFAETLRTTRVRGANFWLQIEGDYPASGAIRNREGKAIGEWRSTGNQTVISGAAIDRRKGETEPTKYRVISKTSTPARLAFSALVWPADWRLPWNEPERPKREPGKDNPPNADKAGKPSKAQVREMLAVIPRGLAYEEWLRVIAAVGDALDDDDAVEALNEWDAEDEPELYAYKLARRLAEVHVGTLFHMAKEYGWVAGSATSDVSPAQWFADRFPALGAEHGWALLEEQNKDGLIVVKDICEPFLAATLGADAVPERPTVFLSAEDRFYTYQPEEGIYVEQRPPLLLTSMSRLLLVASRACPDCNTQALQFRFRDSASLAGVLSHARGLLAQPHDFFTSDLTEFIPCSNGMLRLRDRTLLPFRPDYRRRNKLAVPYNPSARCPLFLDTLMRPALATDDLELLQRCCGLFLVGDNLAQRILILTGTAGGGKGTFIRVLRGIIGANNVGGLRTQLLGERFELGRFLGKTLLYGADVPENFLNHRGASVLKSLTGADPVSLEFKNSNESPSIVCRFNIVVTCNSRLTLHLEGDNDAWRRRLVILPYCNPAPQRKIADLSEIILRDEASGVLNWMLAGLEKIRGDNWQLVVSERQQTVVDDLLLESDSHGVFVREGLIRDGEAQITVADCYTAYVEFCTERGWAALAKNRFSAAIGDAIVRHFGITQRHNIPDEHGKPQRGWKGFRCAVFPPMDSEKAVPAVPAVPKPEFGTDGTTFPKSNVEKGESEEL